MNRIWQPLVGQPTGLRLYPPPRAEHPARDAAAAAAAATTDPEKMTLTSEFSRRRQTFDCRLATMTPILRTTHTEFLVPRGKRHSEPSDRSVALDYDGSISLCLSSIPESHIIHKWMDGAI